MRHKGGNKPARREPASDETPDEVKALLEQGTVEAAARLRELGESEDRATAKAARRALFELRRAGIEPPAEPSQAPAAAPAAPLVRRALATNVAGSGSRLLLIVRDDPYGGSPSVLSFLLHDEKGVVEVARRRMPRRDVDAYFDRLRASETTILAEIPVDYGRHLLAAAAEQNAELRRPIPEGYTEAAREVGEPQQRNDRPLIYAHLDADTVLNDLSISRDAEKLLETPVFRTWIVPPETIGPHAEKFVESQQSRLALDESQLARMGEKVLDDATDELFTPDRLASYKRRLEETALVLFLLERQDEAKQALYHALKLAEPAAPHTIRFARALVQRSVNLLLAMLAEEQKRREQVAPSLIERV